jgi:hypothetical protein
VDGKARRTLLAGGVRRGKFFLDLVRQTESVLALKGETALEVRMAADLERAKKIERASRNAFGPARPV